MFLLAFLPVFFISGFYIEVWEGLANEMFNLTLKVSLWMARDQECEKLHLRGLSLLPHSTNHNQQTEMEYKPSPQAPRRGRGPGSLSPEVRPDLSLSQCPSNSTKGPSCPQISNGIFPTIPGTEKSVGKVAGLAPEVWLLIRPLGAGVPWTQPPHSAPGGFRLGLQSLEKQGVDNFYNSRWVHPQKLLPLA